MTLGTDDGKTARIAHDARFLGADLPRLGERGLPLLVGDVIFLDAALRENVAREVLGVATEQDVGTTAGHVGGDGDGPGATGLRDDVCLLLVELRVEHRMLDATLGEQRGKPFRAFDGDGADQAGLLARMALGDIVGHGVELGVDRTIDEVGQLLANDRPVGRDHLDGKLVDVAELGVLGLGRTGHARELVV